MTPQEEREQRLQLLEDDIGRALRESEASGELRAAPSFGKPMVMNDGYEQTPVELRMGFKILKDAGVVPPEVEVMREISALEAALKTCADEPARRGLLQRIAERRQHLALRLEKLRRSGTL